MSERNIVNVWIYPYLPNEWHCQTFEGIVGIGRTRDEAKVTFDREWNQRAPYNLIEGHPPRQRRQDAPPEAPAAAIEHDAISYKRLAQRFHSDLVGTKKKFTADEVMAILNELRGTK